MEKKTEITYRKVGDYHFLTQIDIYLIQFQLPAILYGKYNTKSETKQEVFTPRKNNKNKRSNHTNFTNFSVTQLVTDELEKFYDF